eukprot:4164913-Amphidinium_carterae.1
MHLYSSIYAHRSVNAQKTRQVFLIGWQCSFLHGPIGTHCPTIPHALQCDPSTVPQSGNISGSTPAS